MKRLIFAVLCMLLLFSTAFAECALPALEEYMTPIDGPIAALTFEPLLESPDAVSSIRTFAIATDGRVAVWSKITLDGKEAGRLLILDANGEKQGEYRLDYDPHSGLKKILFYAADGRLCFGSHMRMTDDKVVVLNTESCSVEELYQLPSLEQLRPYACMRSDTTSFVFSDPQHLSYSERYDSVYELVEYTDSTITVKHRRGGDEIFTIYDETEKVERYERGKERGRRIFIFAVLIPVLILAALMSWGLIWIQKQNGEPVFKTFRKRKETQ